jgi:hypothetical protein
MFSTSRQLIRVAYRDPERVCERLTLYGVHRLAQPAVDWADKTRETRPDAEASELAHELRTQSAQVARIDGAISGTPFFVALVPGYLNYLMQETRMTLRLAALYGRDPHELHTSAEVLKLRGVHRTVEAAEAALIAVRDGGPPPKPTDRRSVRVWYDSITRLLVFGGFLAPPSDDEPTRFVRLRAVFGFFVGAGLWVITWVFPLTFMVMMAWGCESHTRALFRRTVEYYSEDPNAAGPRRPQLTLLQDVDYSARHLLSALVLAVTILVPFGFIVYAVHVRNTVGINLVTALGALVAVSFVIAAGVLGSRR